MQHRHLRGAQTFCKGDSRIGTGEDCCFLAIGENLGQCPYLPTRKVSQLRFERGNCSSDRYLAMHLEFHYGMVFISDTLEKIEI